MIERMRSKVRKMVLDAVEKVSIGKTFLSDNYFIGCFFSKH